MAAAKSILSLQNLRDPGPARESPINQRGDPTTWAGAAIAIARINVRLSQSGLARRLDRTQSYVSKIEVGRRGIDVREFFWIFRRIGADPIPVLSTLFRDDSFRDLEDRPKREAPYRIDDSPEEDDDSSDDEDGAVLGHLKFDQGGAA